MRYSLIVCTCEMLFVGEAAAGASLQSAHETLFRAQNNSSSCTSFELHPRLYRCSAELTIQVWVYDKQVLVLEQALVQA